MLPGLDAATALVACERLRVAVRDHAWRPVVGDLPVTSSLGLATTFAGAATTSQLLALADQRLYASKFSGRDRVTGGP